MNETDVNRNVGRNKMGELTDAKVKAIVCDACGRIRPFCKCKREVYGERNQMSQLRVPGES